MHKVHKNAYFVAIVWSFCSFYPFVLGSFGGGGGGTKFGSESRIKMLSQRVVLDTRCIEWVGHCLVMKSWRCPSKGLAGVGGIALDRIGLN
eukprot:6382292-Amphidinium_carterae.1